MLLGLGFLVAGPPVAARQEAERRGTERLTPALALSLAHQQDLWLLLSSALDRSDVAAGDSAVDGLLGVASEIGFTRYPDLAAALVLRAVEASRHGAQGQAEWALFAAERLDPGNAGTRFARSEVLWRGKRFFASVGAQLSGYSRLGAERLGRYLLAANALLWLATSLMLAAVAFVAVEAASKGPALMRDLGSSLRSFLPVPLGYLVATLSLLWPFILPEGWLWASLLWAVLLWSYGSTSERWTLGGAIALLGVLPAAVALLPALLAGPLDVNMRFLDRLATGRLYGELLPDMFRLREALPTSSAVEHLLADTHLRLGQAEVARPDYRSLADAEPTNGPVYNNLGAFHLYRLEYTAAIPFLLAALDDPRSQAAAAFNLSQVYSQLLEFAESESYLVRARMSSPESVTEWIEAETPAALVFSGLARLPEIRHSLMARVAVPRWRAAQLLPLLVAGVALGLAPLVKVLNELSGRGRVRFVHEPDSRLERLAHRLVPGLRHAAAGDGGRAFLAVLFPMALFACYWVAAHGFVLWGSYTPSASGFRLVLGAAIAWWLFSRWRS